jgi:hypothetical protein
MSKLLATILLAAALPATAEDIWRCGPDGRSFQATPCSGGQMLAVVAGPDAAAVAEAQAVRAREQLALSAQRRERERSAVAAAGFSTTAAPPPKLKPGRSGPAGCGTSPKAARGSPRGPGLPECS